jgi:hypothetical protein
MQVVGFQYLHFYFVAAKCIKNHLSGVLSETKEERANRGFTHLHFFAYFCALKETMKIIMGNFICNVYHVKRIGKLDLMQ